MCFFSKPQVVYVPTPPPAAETTPDAVETIDTPVVDNSGQTNTPTDTPSGNNTGSNNTTTDTSDQNVTVNGETVQLPPPAPPAAPPVLANQPMFYGGGGGGGSTNQVNNPVMQNIYDPTNPESGVNREKGSTFKKARGTSQLRVDLDPVIATMAKNTGLQINK